MLEAWVRSGAPAFDVLAWVIAPDSISVSPPRLPGADVRPDANSLEVRAQVAQLVARTALTQAKSEIAIGFWHGLSEKEIATWLGEPKNTVHEHVRRLYRDQRWPEVRCRVTVALAVERELSEPTG